MALLLNKTLSSIFLNFIATYPACGLLVRIGLHVCPALPAVLILMEIVSLVSVLLCGAENKPAM